jgi:hypothetical protein
MTKLSVHVSGMTAFQNCERAWMYQYLLGYQSPQDSDPITFGNWGHYCLRLVAQGKTYAEALAATRARAETLAQARGAWLNPELWDQFANLMKAHELWQQHSDNLYVDSNLEYISLEQDFHMEYQGYQFGGVWDGLARHNQLQGLYLIERKFTRDPNSLERGVKWDYQPRFYAWAVEQQLGVPVVGVIYEIIRRCDPTQVKILQNGLPSKAKGELDGTTPEFYMPLLMTKAQEAGLNTNTVMADYAEALRYLSLNDNPIFRRVLVAMPDGWKTNAARTMFYRAAQMEAAQAMGEDLPAKLNRYDCHWQCPYKWVCAAQDDGADWQMLLEATFVKDKERFDAQ